MSPVRYAIVGLGHIIQQAVLPAFHARGVNSEIAAFVSGSASKARKLAKHYGVERVVAYEDYEALLDEGEVDAVYVGVPNALHAEFAIPALKRGMHVLCEKPLAESVESCRAMIATAKKSGAKLMTAYRLHFDPTNLNIISEIKKGTIGDPKYFQSIFSYQIRKENTRLEKEMAGGALFDIGIYCINAARYLFQAEPEAVLGCVIGGEDKRFREVDGSVAVTLYFSEDRIATFYASFAAFPRSQFEIIGTRGRITADPAYEYAEGLAYTIQTRKRSREVQAKKHDQFAAELKYFAECIRTGKKVEPDGEEGLADLRIIEAIRHSSSERKIVKLAQFRTDYPTKRLAQRISPTRKATRLVAVQRASK